MLHRTQSQNTAKFSEGTEIRRRNVTKTPKVSHFCPFFTQKLHSTFWSTNWPSPLSRLRGLLASESPCCLFQVCAEADSLSLGINFNFPAGRFSMAHLGSDFPTPSLLYRESLGWLEQRPVGKEEVLRWGRWHVDWRGSKIHAVQS